MNKTNSGKDKNIKKRKNIRIVGNYTAFGHSPQEAFQTLMNEIYFRSDQRGHRSLTKFLDKSGNYIDEPTFMNHGGQFRGYFIIDGEDIHHVVAYLINGVVNKGAKQWVAMAEVSRVKIRAEPIGTV